MKMKNKVKDILEEALGKIEEEVTKKQKKTATTAAASGVNIKGFVDADFSAVKGKAGSANK